MTFSTSAAIDLMTEVATHCSSDRFSGLGVIFYTPPLSLPVIPLGNTALFPYSLPLGGLDSIAKLLAEISSTDSIWHDGFHLIDTKSFELTHVSQFFSPPITLAPVAPQYHKPVGARHMAAILGSQLSSVDCVALSGNRGLVEIFRNGSLVSISK